MVVGLGVAAAVGLALWPPIRQDLRYHDFADQRWHHALNVWSNLPFVGVGVVGCWVVGRNGYGWVWLCFFAGVVLTGIGSAYYHRRPCNETLVWDRLGMTTAFAPFLAGIVADRVGAAAGNWLFGPALAVGLGSVWYWKRTDDLRPYAWVQFFPMLAIPLLAVLVHGNGRDARSTLATADILVVIGWYALAKVFEVMDRPVFRWTGMSGHSWKHVFAAAGCGWVLVALAR
jgi:hypothetical protein